MLMLLPLLAIYLLVGAVILRAAVSLSNRIIRNRVPQAAAVEDAGYTSPLQDPDAAENPYSVPASTTVALDARTTTIPEPSFGYACVVVIAQVIVSSIGTGVIGFLMGLVIRDIGPNAPELVFLSVRFIRLFGLIVACPINAGVFALMLPTSYRRGLLVAVIQIVIVVATFLVIGGVIWAVMSGF